MQYAFLEVVSEVRKSLGQGLKVTLKQGNIPSQST